MTDEERGFLAGLYFSVAVLYSKRESKVSGGVADALVAVGNQLMGYDVMYSVRKTDDGEK